MGTKPPSLSGDVYKDLIAILVYHDGRPLELEILPSGFDPDLQYDAEGSSLGVTKKTLVAAFVLAQRVFFDYLKVKSNTKVPTRKSETAAEMTLEDQESESEAYVASTVLLIFDPEHLTAANFRKRRLNNPRVWNSSHLPLLLEYEIRWTLNILTSPLHRHSKSPTLWSHLLWLHKKQGNIQEQGWRQIFLEHSDFRDRKRDVLERPVVERHVRHTWEAMVENVLKAGERHPRNYYAFTYARQMLPICAGWQPQSITSPDSRNSTKYDTYSAGDDTAAELAADVMPKVHAWCLAHPGDISGWSFLLWLMARSWNRWNRKLCQHIVVRTATWAASPGIRWKGESLWWFLQATCKMPSDENMCLPTAVEGLQAKKPGENTAQLSWRDFRRLVLEGHD